jgi:dihydrofolate reductase
MRHLPLLRIDPPSYTVLGSVPPTRNHHTRQKQEVKMSELTADMFVSLDGFSAGPGGSQNWIGEYANPGREFGDLINDVLNEPQTIIVGRVTYQVLAGFWPSAAEGPTMQMNRLPKVVFSRTLDEPLAWNNSRLAKRDLEEEITAMKEESEVPLRTIGSISLVRSLMQLRLVDRLRLVVFPVILGSEGREPIFQSLDLTRLKLLRSQVLDANELVLEYQPEPVHEG